MADTVTIDRAEYERLLAIAEDAEDIRDADRVRAAIARGDEELIPSEFANRLIDRENPITVYREMRGLSGNALAERAGVNRVQLLDIEHNRKRGSVETLRKIAAALSLKIDDILGDMWVVAQRPDSKSPVEPREVLFVTNDRNEAIGWIERHLTENHSSSRYDEEQDLWRATRSDGTRWRLQVE